MSGVSTPSAPNPRAPLALNVRLITPGWGNLRDKNYYPADVLKRDAKVFEGVKMYATDHRENEKSVRTEVARIDRVHCFADDGAPIARVTVFDPDFAEQTRNRAAAGLLESLECSILAYGRTKPGKVDGQAGNVVEAITSARSVDWVTKAGAGGHAISLAESEHPNGGPLGQVGGVTAAERESNMALGKNEVAAALEASGLPENVQTALAAAEYPDAAALLAAIIAVQSLKSGETPEPPAEEEPVPGDDDETPAAESELPEADIQAALAKTRLPEPARARLAGAKYRSLAELNAAVTAETAYLKSVTGSGRPVSPGKTQPAAPRTLAERDKTVDRVLDRHFASGRAPAKEK
jgi:hypothetical protein